MNSFQQERHPDFPICKRCISKPCERLLSGHVYPGKMIFVHRKHFIGAPCMGPSQIQTQTSSSDNEALTDTLVTTSESVTISNIRWNALQDRTKTTAHIGDMVELSADIKGIPEGAPATFDIFDCTREPPFLITSIKGKNTNGTSVVQWLIDDPNQHGARLVPVFEVSARSKTGGKCTIAIEKTRTVRIRLPIDPNDAETLDDTFTLYSTDTAQRFRETKTVSDDCIEGDAFIDLEFENVPENLLYTLEIDPGGKGRTYNMFENDSLEPRGQS